MHAQRNSGNYLTWTKNIKKYDVVVFDDFELRNYTHDESAFLVDFLEDRYQKNIHIFTS
jgi:DNA replication protein DnaC